MLIGKKKKIAKHILQKADGGEQSAFDFLLSDYLEGVFKNRLTAMGITKIAIHIDWYDHIKCLGVQGYCQEYNIDLQIYPDEFCLSFDKDEPDEGVTYPLESKEQFYRALADSTKALL